MSDTYRTARGTRVTTTQPPLFVESYEDAIKALILALGGGKKVGTMLRPEMSADAASRWLSDCLNHDRRETLSLDQLALLRRAGRDAGCHVLAAYEAQNAGYAEPNPIDPEDERAELERRVINSLGEFKNLVARLENVTRRK